MLKHSLRFNLREHETINDTSPLKPRLYLKNAYKNIAYGFNRREQDKINNTSPDVTINRSMRRLTIRPQG